MSGEYWTTVAKDDLRLAADGTVYRRTPRGNWKKLARIAHRPSREKLRLRELDEERKRLVARGNRREKKVQALESRRERAARRTVRRAYAALLVVAALLLAVGVGWAQQTMQIVIDNQGDHHLQFYGECGDQAKRLTYVPPETIIKTTWYVARDLCASGEIVIQGDGLRWKFPARDFVMGEYDGALICLYPGVAAQGSYSFFGDLADGKVMPPGCAPERRDAPRPGPARPAVQT